MKKILILMIITLFISISCGNEKKDNENKIRLNTIFHGIDISQFKNKSVNEFLESIDRNNFNGNCSVFDWKLDGWLFGYTDSLFIYVYINNFKYLKITNLNDRSGDSTWNVNNILKEQISGVKIISTKGNKRFIAGF